MMKMAFLGLGLMGSCMAERLLDHYGSLMIWNRTASTCNTLSARGVIVVLEFSELLQAPVELFEYIEIYYNRRRRHSTLGWLSPVAFEQLYY